MTFGYTFFFNHININIITIIIFLTKILYIKEYIKIILF